MEGQSPEVQQLRSEAKNWFNQISKYQVDELMAIFELPISLAFILNVFYAMITNQAIDKNKDFVKVLNSSQPVQFDTRKLSIKFQQIFREGYQQRSINQVVNEFDPLKLSEETVKYLKRVRVESLSGPEPDVTEQKILNTSHLGHKLWNWCKCMLQIRRKVIPEEE